MQLVQGCTFLQSVTQSTNLGLQKKQLQHIALQCSEELRTQYMAKIMQKFNQEILYGYSLRGMRATDHIGRKHINAMTVMSLEGVKDVYLSEENVNGDIFEDFVKTIFSLF